MRKAKFFVCFLLTIGSAVQSDGAPASGKYFDRAIFVVFENTDYSKAIKQPFFRTLADQGAHFANFSAPTHPSQGNYVALTSGDTNGVKDDRKVDLDVENIADLLETKGLTWKVYAEDYPGGCFTGKTSLGYARKHNPFISYVNIQNNPKRCANIVSAKEFDSDAARGALPNYVFYVPNLDSDGHDTGVVFADTWYKEKFTPYLNDTHFMANTILISTFDESAGGFKNQIYTSVVGPAVRPTVVAESLNSYSLLALIEENWSLGNLGKKDVSAVRIHDIWR